jgi:micrococcal nuclease
MAATLMLVLALGATQMLHLSFAPVRASAPSSVSGLHARAIDGDTIELTATGEQIRLPNIDTPETGDRANCAAEREAGERAKQAARALLGDGVVSVWRTGRTDNYGRTIGYVSIDGHDMGQIMIDRRLARPWRGSREPWCGASGRLIGA